MVVKVRETDNVKHEALRRVDRKVFVVQSNEWMLTGHIVRMNCLLEHVIEGRIEGILEMTYGAIKNK
jgi:hypothetical protein